MRSNKYYAVPEEGESLEHRSHKYIKKIRKNGKWVYYYDRDKAEKAYGDEYLAMVKKAGSKNEYEKANQYFEDQVASLTGKTGFAGGVAAAKYVTENPDSLSSRQLIETKNQLDRSEKAARQYNYEYGKAKTEADKARKEKDVYDKYFNFSPERVAEVKNKIAKAQMPSKIAKGKAMNAAKRKKVGSSKMSAGKKKNVLQKGSDLVKKILKHSGMEDGEYLEHRSHKYFFKKRVNGKWRYYYYDPKREFAERRLADENRIDTDKGNGTWTRFVDKPALFPTSHGITEYDMSKNQEKRKLSSSSSLGNDRVLSDQTENKLKAKSNAANVLKKESSNLASSKQKQAGYKKAASGLFSTVDGKKARNAAIDYDKKARSYNSSIKKSGEAINAAKRKASGSSSLANQKQSTKKKKTSKISKTLKKGQSIINKLLGR